MTKIVIFGSKLLSSFLMLETYTFSRIYAADRQAVVTFKIYNSGLDRLCATHFFTLHPLGLDPQFGNHWARSTNQPLCEATVTRPIFAEPW